mgnify:FL=1
MRNSILSMLLLLGVLSLSSCKKQEIDPAPENNNKPVFYCETKSALEIQTEDLVEDCYVFGYNGGNSANFGSSRNLQVGSWRGVEDIYGMYYDNIIYLKFDYAQLPASAVIDRAFITLYVDTFRYNSMPKYVTYGHDIEDDTKKIQVSNVTGDWSESTLNYFNQPSSSAVSATMTAVTKNKFETYSFDVTEILKEQLASGNKGFKIDMINFSRHNLLRFASSENAYPSLCPKITILY